MRAGLRQERESGEGEERLTSRGLSQYITLLQAVNSFGVWLKRYFRALKHTHTQTQAHTYSLVFLSFGASYFADKIDEMATQVS